MPSSDLGTFITTYGPIGGVVILFLWQLYKDIRARNKALDKREQGQDARDSDLAKAFNKQLDIFQETSKSNAQAAAEAAQTSAAANDRAATVFDKVTNRLDAMTAQLQIAGEQRADQLIILKTIIGQLANPEPRFTAVVEDIKRPILKAVEDRTMDVTRAVITELQEGLKKLTLEVQKLQGGQGQVLVEIESLKTLVDKLQPTAVPAPTQTVNVTYPGAVTPPPTDAPAQPSEPEKKE